MTQHTPNLPIPAGATADRDWPSITSDGVPVRGLVWSEHNTAKVGLSIYGQQYGDDGRWTRAISLFGDDVELTAGEARELAAKLLEAADAMDRLQ